jgi:hypothetical protein
MLVPESGQANTDDHLEELRGIDQQQYLTECHLLDLKQDSETSAAISRIAGGLVYPIIRNAD